MRKLMQLGGNDERQKEENRHADGQGAAGLYGVHLSFFDRAAMASRAEPIGCSDGMLHRQARERELVRMVGAGAPRRRALRRCSGPAALVVLRMAREYNRRHGQAAIGLSPARARRSLDNGSAG